MSTKLVKKDSEFSEVLGIIRAGRAKAYKAFNVVLIDTYWAVGAHLSSRVAGGGWGKGVVLELSEWLLRKAPHLKGFSASNLWRMKQFYEVYADEPKLAQPHDYGAEQTAGRARVLSEAGRRCSCRAQHE